MRRSAHHTPSESSLLRGVDLIRHKEKHRKKKKKQQKAEVIYPEMHVLLPCMIHSMSIRKKQALRWFAVSGEYEFIAKHKLQSVYLLFLRRIFGFWWALVSSCNSSGAWNWCHRYLSYTLFFDSFCCCWESHTQRMCRVFGRNMCCLYVLLCRREGERDLREKNIISRNCGTN